ncbi:MAG: hypothetical protein JEZ04_21605 [Spirochaetales bacterium]|nr:hypothetical protein [Spirochaetales bacterium]
MEVQVFQTNGIILVCIGIFLVVAILVGLMYKKKINATEDFTAAGRSLTWPFIMASVVATWIGAAVILGGASEVYEYGFQGIVWDPFATTCTLLLGGFFVVKRLRKTRSVTVGDFYTNRYGDKMATIFTLAQAITGLAWVAAQFKSFGILIHMTTGFNSNIATIIGAVVIVFVAMTGGLWALSRTDMISFIIITISLVFMVPFTVSAVGGLGNFFSSAGNLADLPEFSIFYNFTKGADGSPHGFYWYGGILGVLYALSAWIALGVGDLSCPVLNARTLAAKSERHAAKGFILGGIIYFILGMIPVFIGVAAYILSKGQMPEESLDYILPWFVQNYMPDWLGVLFMVSLAAAIVSTAGDTVLIDSSIFVSTLVKRLNPDITDSQIVRKLIWALPVYALLSYLVTFAGGIYELLVFSGASLFPTIVTSYLFGLFWKKANQKGAIASFWAGLIGWLILTFFIFLPAATNYFDEGVHLIKDFSYIVSEGYLEDSVYIAAVPAWIISIAAMIVISLKTQKSDPPKPITDIDGIELDSVVMN